MQKKSVIIISVLAILVILLVVEFKVSEYRRMAMDIGIYVPVSCEMYYKDTHAGFHMDGEVYARVYFSNGQAKRFIKKIKENEHWNNLPMDAEFQEEVTIDKYGDNMELPIIENGYWFFLDRHSEAINKYDEKAIYDRYSYNYTVAIFDTDTNILYYYELDT